MTKKNFYEKGQTIENEPANSYVFMAICGNETFDNIQIQFSL